PVVVVLSAAERRRKPVVDRIRAAHASDDAVADVVFRIEILQPVRVVVEVVVPVVQVAVGVVLLRLQFVHVDLAAEPDELLEDAGVVALARAVMSGSLNVLDVSRRGELAADAEVARERARQIAERVVRDDTLGLVVSNGKPAVRVVGAARHGESVGEAVSGLEEAVGVIRMRNEGSRYPVALSIDRAIELWNQLAVHARSVALVVPVVHATALAILEREVSAGTLTVEV